MREDSTLEEGQPFAWLVTAGEMGVRLRSVDWSATPIGPAETWPQSLRIALQMCLASPTAMLLCWGPSRTLFSNDACSQWPGATGHATALGRPAHEALPEFWNRVGATMELAFATGEARHVEDIPTLVDREGAIEPACIALTIVPVFGEAGAVEGVVCACAEHEDAFRTSAARLARELADTKSLQAISTRLIQEKRVEALYEAILDAAIAVTQSDMGSMQRLDRERNELELLVWKGFDPASAASWQRVGVDSPTSCGLALKLGERVVVPDVESSTFLGGDENLALFRRSGIRAVQSTPLTSRSGRILGMISTHWREPHELSEREMDLVDVLARQAADLVERIEAEDALRTSEERYHALAGVLTSVVWNTDAAGAFVAEQPEWARFTGQTWEEYRGWGWADALHPEDREPVRELWRAALSAGTTYEARGRLWHAPSGEYRYVEARAVPLVDAGGVTREWVGTITDVHEQRQNEVNARLLAELGERIRMAEDPDALLAEVSRVVGEHLRVRRSFFVEIDEAGDQGLIRSDYSPGTESVVGEYRLSEYSSLARREIAAGHTVVNCDASADPRTADSYGAVYGPRGERAYVAVPLMRERRWVGTFWISTDEPYRWPARLVALVETVAERTWNAAEKLRLDAAVRESEATLREANRLKDEFLATLSHELRTPLNAITGWARLLADGGLDEATARRGAEAIVRNATLQTKLIEDILDVSRIVTGKVRLDVRPTDVLQTVLTALESVKPAADAKQLRIEAHVDPSLETIEADPERLEQVLWNLLTNAVKFTPARGAISVSVRSEGASVEIAVADSGVGIGPEFLPYVFERFRQADGTTTRRHGGLGLGLAIVRHLVELHGGSVRVESPGAGLGSTFVVRLPRGAVPQAGDPPTGVAVPRSAISPATGVERLDGTRVLLVDDESDSRDVANRVLSGAGAGVRAVASAAEALDVLSVWRPDVLVADIGMPDEDGYHLIARVRALAEHRGGAVPALALTAYARSEDRSRALEAGFDLHVVKPVEPRDLVAAVARLRPRDARRERETSGAAPGVDE